MLRKLKVYHSNLWREWWCDYGLFCDNTSDWIVSHMVEWSVKDELETICLSNRSMHFPDSKEEKQVEYQDTWGPSQNLKTGTPPCSITKYKSEQSQVELLSRHFGNTFVLSPNHLKPLRFGSPNSLVSFRAKITQSSSMWFSMVQITQEKLTASTIWYTWCRWSRMIICC